MKNSISTMALEEKKVFKQILTKTKKIEFLCIISIKKIRAPILVHGQYN